VNYIAIWALTGLGWLDESWEREFLGAMLAPFNDPIFDFFGNLISVPFE